MHIATTEVTCIKKLIAAMFAWSFLLLTACGTAFTNQDLEKPELAYEYIDICYVSDDGTIESESMYLPYSASIIFDEWAARNGIDDVSAPEFKREDNKQIIYPDDPDAPFATITVIPADHAVLYITLPSKFEIYFEGEKGQLTAESLKNTFLGFLDYDEVYLSIES